MRQALDLASEHANERSQIVEAEPDVVIQALLRFAEPVRDVLLDLVKRLGSNLADNGDVPEQPAAPSEHRVYEAVDELDEPDREEEASEGEQEGQRLDDRRGERSYFGEVQRHRLQPILTLGDVLAGNLVELQAVVVDVHVLGARRE